MGLKGFFGNLLKGIATAIGGAIGGPIGATIASQVFEWADNAFFSNSLTDNTGWFVPQPQQPNVPTFNQGMNAFTNTNAIDIIIDPDVLEAEGLDIDQNLTPEQAELIRIKSLEKWLKNKITPNWINNFFGILKNKSEASEDYRTTLNIILLRLETLRLYYTGIANKIKTQGLNGVGTIEEVIAEAEIKSKAELFEVLSQAMRNAYEQVLSETGKAVYQKTIPNFKASKYNLQGKAPEAINFDFEAITSIKLYVFDPSDNITINYTDGTQGNTTTQAQVPDTPSVTETIPTATSTNQQIKTAGLWLIGFIGAGWLWKQFNYKPQNN